MSAPIASSPSEGPWLEALPAIVATLRSDVPLESLGELRTDLISMALLADHYVALVSHEGEQVEGVCTDKASQTGAHQYTKRCIFCGQTP
ncbi:MAG: hypothetical protein DRR06_18780 [Gammaproteobacteria bacterium]|nr:MAG: hypothetical protein DRR06_18780 [Gammaproteobacteria bacterium]